MNILLVNWSWYPTGGDWTYIENVKKLYEVKGHQVIPFSTNNIKNVSTPYAKYFVDAYDFKELNKHKNISNGIKALKTSVISKNALMKLDMLLDDFKIDVAHLNNIHHYLTPAIIEQLSKRGIKIIWTLHDFKIICPENSFISNGKLCEKCMTGNFYYCAVNLCKRKSFLASSLASFEAYYYHERRTYNLVDYFLCPSNFLKKKFEQFGFENAKMVVTNSCYDISQIDKYIYLNSQKKGKETANKYVLYVGRLEEIKGVQTLIDAVSNSDIQIKIVGSGSFSDQFKTQAGNSKNIEFLGFKSKEEVFELTMQSLFVVCPSICYENLPFSIIESFLFNKPVVGADIGGIPELVVNELTGLLFEPGNADHLFEKLNYLWRNENIVHTYGEAARQKAYELVNFSDHWNKINALLHSFTNEILPVEI